MFQSVVKITISSEGYYNHVGEVVYYRSGMSPDFVERWLWFFEYMAARIKVAHPRRRVVMWYGSVDIMLGDEWHEHRRLALLKSRQAKLKQLQRILPDSDLFGFGEADHAGRISEVIHQIHLLERDEFLISDFPTYINHIKLFL